MSNDVHGRDVAGNSYEVPDRIAARAIEIDRRSNGEIERLKEEAARVLKSQAPTRQKYVRLAKIADDVAAFISPSTPCRRGCSHCCYMAVPISMTEAGLLSAASGRPIDEAAGLPPAIYNPTAFVDQLDANVGKFSGVPCTFLVNDECSVYGVRPIACRNHHVLEDDNSKCDTKKSKEPLSAFDSSWIDYSAASLTISEPYADIREFFPTQKAET